MNRPHQPGRILPDVWILLLAAFAVLAAAGRHPGAIAQAQWVTNGNDVNTTNTGNAGVGTTAPVAKLDVTNSEDKTQIRFGMGSGNSGGFLFSNGPGHAVFSGGTGWDGGWFARSMSASFMQLNGGSVSFFGNTGLTVGSLFTPSELMRITPSGNVGIGTTNPSRLLEISASSANTSPFMASTAALSVFNTNTTANNTADFSFRTFDSAGAGITPAKIVAVFTNHTAGASAGDLTFVTLNASAAAERMRVTGGGNVGIGTAAPGFKLDVQGGQVNASGGLCIAGDCKTAWSQVGGSASQWTTSGSNIYYNTGSVGIGTATPSSARLHLYSPGNTYLRIGAPLASQSAIAFNDDTNGQDIVLFRPEGTRNFSLWTATAGQALGVTQAGNVGIGGGNPTYPLDVNMAAQPVGGVTYGVRLQQTLTENTNNFGNATALYINPTFVDGMAVGNTHNALVTTNGNVGIGVATTGAALDVQSPGVANGQAATYGTRFQQTLNSAGNNSNSVAVLINPNFNDGMAVGTAHTGLAVTSGNVGFGTLTPGYRVDVQGGQVNASGGLCIAGDCKTAWSQVGGSGTSSQWATSGSNISFNSGSVGIGTATPTQLLDVSGSGEVKARAAGTLSAAILLQESTGTTTWSEWQQYYDRLRLNMNNGSTTKADVMTILSSGKVGIGKDTPTEALDVVGNIRATGSVSATYQDVAEWVPSTQKLAAGTVVVLDADRTNHVLAATKAYDTGVAGVVSAEPGIILGVGSADKLKIATTGRVKVKVDATRAPIKVGDLLVTSGVEGVAMKSVPVDLGGTQIHRPGTIVGKALESLESGTGEILVLLSLQ